MYGRFFSRGYSTASKVASTVNALRGKHTLPDLPYDYNALEPIVSAQIMQLHHGAHHKTYVTQLNVTEEKYAAALEKRDLTMQIQLQPLLKFNGGGHVNHSLFWKNLCPTTSFEPPTVLKEPLERSFQSVDHFIQQFNATTAAIQGSGWGWLCYHPSLKQLVITTTANQDPVEATQGLIPLLGIDVWEHAYYLDYKNVRGDYLKNIWKVVNWKEVEKRFQACI